LKRRSDGSKGSTNGEGSSTLEPYRERQDNRREFTKILKNYCLVLNHSHQSGPAPILIGYSEKQKRRKNRKKGRISQKKDEREKEKGGGPVAVNGRVSARSLGLIAREDRNRRKRNVGSHRGGRKLYSGRLCTRGGRLRRDMESGNQGHGRASKKEVAAQEKPDTFPKRNKKKENVRT